MQVLARVARGSSLAGPVKCGPRGALIVGPCGATCAQCKDDGVREGHRGSLRVEEIIPTSPTETLYYISGGNANKDD